MNGLIVGIQGKGKDKVYRVVSYAKGKDGIQYKKQVVHEEQLKNALAEKKIKLDNADLVDGKIKGITGDLSRFNSVDGLNPKVILSEMVADDKVIGYRLVSYDGTVSAIRLKDVISYCEKVNEKFGAKGAPIQNAMFVPASENGKAHIRAYPGQVFNKEVIERKKVNDTKVAIVDKKANAEKVNSKLEELFNKDQIEQLRLGKKHGVDIRLMGNNKLSAEQMKEIRKALEDGINARVFASPEFSSEVMAALRINAKYGVDIKYFINPRYNAEQIFELSTGYLSGVDITKYADPKLSATDMSKKRIYLESQLWNEVQAKEKKVI